MALDPGTALRFALQEAVVGRYSIERELGRGGMGIVYLARDVRLDRPVALKLLPPERSSVASIRERFLHEARMAARLSHPNIVPIHAVEEIGEFVFFAMQYVAGETLGDRLRRQRKLPPWDAARLLRDVAWALAYAHAQGVTHRDIKPDNILIDHDGRALVADFGIAHHTSDAPIAGRVQGTPEYLSPEQAAGAPCDARADLYSLGAVAFHALTGQPPFTGDTASLLAQHLTAEAPRLVDAAPELPARLAAAVDRALRKDPADRWPAAETMAEAFAPPLPMTADLPVPVRIWAERGRELKGFYVVWSLIFYGLSTLVFTAATNAGQWPLGAKVIFGFFMMAIPAPWIGHALWRLVETRRALEAGASVEDFRHAVEVTRARREEEMRFDATRSVHWLPKLVRRVTYAGFFASLSVLIAGRMSGADFFQSGWFAAFVLPTLIVLGGGLFGLIIPGRRLKPTDPWARLRARFWRSAPGRLFARVAASGLPASNAAWASWRPTEVALGGATETLHAALPVAQRDALADLPTVVARLEHEAVHARAQLDGGVEGPWAARLEAAVSAIETLRLGLLRLHADQAEVGSLTLDLEKARELSEQIGYLVEGVREVDELLG
ncbi:MAG: serine/threonine-protein kinase [Gemmatimonadales bacterium]|nr:serine/threonine-protein kinase [Gemmatimonadales bacterium]